jgi:hypothetical protein
MSSPAVTPISVAPGKVSKFFDSAILKGFMLVLNVISIIFIYIYTAITGVDPTTMNDLKKNFIIILVFSVVVMLTWAFLSISLFAASPEALTYYTIIMLAVLLGLSFMSISISVINKVSTAS